MANQNRGWIGVDLDGTLAKFNGDAWDPLAIGDPIPIMVKKVRHVLAKGFEVRIFTARVDGGRAALEMGNPAGANYRDVSAIRRRIEDWTEKHIGVRLKVTNQKDYGMVELWDDRARRIEFNTGKFAR